MKKSFILISIFLFIFAFSCTFNLFEGDVESNYKSIKTPSEKIEYARQILASGDKEKISQVLALIKADLDATPSIFTGDDLIAANQIVGNLLVSESGFNDVVADVISTMISSSESNTAPDLATTIVDTNGDGTLDQGEIDSIIAMAESLAEAAYYIDAAAEDQPENLDLQIQNVIANLAAAVTNISNLSEQQLEELTNYINGTSSTQPTFWSEIEQNINNAADSVNNLLNNAPQDSFYYGIAQALQQLFAGVNS
ncbi:MAG: hypothetical protein WH035_03825 [Spirochaetota bacterium]